MLKRIKLACGMVMAIALTCATGHAALRWRNLAETYTSFADIKPILINNDDRTIFLSRVSPFARLLRYNTESKQWELGHQGFICGNVPDEGVPIPIEAHAESDISVAWYRSTGDDAIPKSFFVQNPKSFFTPGPEFQRPLSGRYKLALQYALVPWTVAQHPKQLFTIESPEFNVVQ